jgi:hypothetical protein
VTISRLSQPARTEAVALIVAAVGIVVQIIGGVNYPAVPPGLIILLVGAALVAFLPWRWAPVFGVAGALFLLFGAAAAASSRDHLSQPGHPGAFIGSWIQLAAVVVALAAGIAALAVRNRRMARA